MKDIYDLLNDTYVEIDQYQQVKLTKKEKQMILKNMKSSVSGHKKKRIGKFVFAATAAAVVVMTTIFYEDINAMAMETVANIIEMIHGNTKNDYVEKVNTVAVAEGVTMDLIKVSREDAKIRVNYKLTFENDISVFETMRDNLGYKNRSVYYTDIFGGCNIYIDGRDINDIINSYTADQEPFYYYEVNDVSITSHELEQELVIYLNNKDYNKDMNIKLDYSNISVGDRIFEGHCIVEYTLVAGKYTNEIDKSVLDLNCTSLNGTGYHINGYAFTNNGLKVYAELIPGPEGFEASPVVYLKAEDDLGNQYLYYPIHDVNDLNKMTFYIYDGPADSNNEYDDYLAEGAVRMTLALYEEQYDYDTYIRSENKISEDFSLELVLTE